MEESDPYSTHIPVLISAVLQSKGVVAEFGSGHYSTPILHELCHDRHLFSFDHDPDWLNSFMYLNRENHILGVTEQNDDWSSVDAVLEAWLALSKERLGVIFVDNGADVANRVRTIKRWGHLAQFVVIHDCNVGAYGFDEVIPTFKYCFEYKPYVIHTMVLSNQEPFAMKANHEGLIR